MIGGINTGSVPVTGKHVAAPGDPREAKLRKAAEGLEGVFVEQLYKAMRAGSASGAGFVDGGAGEEMFTGLMDQQIAAETPKHWRGGLSDALYRQMHRAMTSAPSGPPAGAPSPSDPAVR